jgi:hypothetical protein
MSALRPWLSSGSSGSGLTDDQLAPQARWDTYCGVIMDIIEGCVVFPVFLLNIINACTQYYVQSECGERPPNKYSRTSFAYTGSVQLDHITQGLLHSLVSSDSSLTHYQSQRLFCSLFGSQLWLRGCQRPGAEDANQGSTAVQSGGNNHHVGAEEANRREFLEDTSRHIRLVHTQRCLLKWLSLLW